MKLQINLNRSAYSEKFKDLFSCKKRIICLFGGRGSGKTDHAIAKLILDSFQLNYFKCLYVNKEFANIRDQQYSAIKKIIFRMKLEDYFTFYNGTYRIVNNYTGNTFLPKGLDDPEKTKGIDDVTHIFWDEINKGTKEDFTTLNKLLRTPLAKYLQFIFCFNPVSDKHWLRTFFFKDNDWYSFKEEFKSFFVSHSTYKDNEFINQEEYLETLLTDNYDESQINCDVYGLWGNPKNENPFINTFNREKHISTEPILWDRSMQTYISVDFNVNPMTAVVIQCDLHLRKIRIVNEFRDLNSDVYKLCNWIKQNYDTRTIYITGDSSGNNRHAYSQNSLSGYQIIRDELNLVFSQMKVEKGKPKGYVETKRLIGNAVFARHTNILINNAPFLVEDLETVKVKPDGQMDKLGDATKSHLLDGLLDGFYTIFKGNVANIR